MAIAKPSNFDYITPAVAPAVMPERPLEPSFMDTLGSSFTRIPIYSDPLMYLAEGFDETYYKPDPNFDVGGVTKASPYWNTPLRDNFAEAQNQQQWDYIDKKIKRENKAREIREASGWTGFFTDLAVGMTSPENWLPGVTPYRGVAGVVSAAGLGLVSVSINEVVKQAAQETRTTEETAMNLVSGAILGGLFGVAANGFRGWQQSRLVRQLSDDMAPDLKSKYGNNSITAQFDNESLPVVVNSNNTIFTPSTLPIGEVRTLRELEAFSDIRAQVIKAIPDLSAMETKAAELQDFVNTAQARLAELSSVKQTKAVKAEIAELTPIATNKTNELSALLQGKQTQIAEVLKDWEVNSPAAAALRDLEIPVDQFMRETIQAFDEAPISGMRDLESSVVQDGLNFSPPSVFGAVGAQVSRVSAGPLKHVKWVRKSGATMLSPVAQTLSQSMFPLARDTMAALGTAGLRFAGNAKGIAAAAGGTIETIISRRRDTLAYKATVYLDAAYADYLFDGSKKTFGNLRARLQSTAGQTDGKWTRSEFNKEVSRALREGDTHPEPPVASAAKFLRAVVFDPLLKEAQDVKLFGEVDLKGDLSYLTRIYDIDAMMARPNEFVARVAAHYKELLIEQAGGWQKIYARAKDRVTQAETLAKLTPDEIAKLQDELKIARQQMGETDAEIQLKSSIRERSQLKKAIRETGETPEIKADLEQIQGEIEALRETLAPTLRDKRDIARRLRMLDATYTGAAEKRAGIEARIEKIEEQALLSLNNVMSRGRELERTMAELTVPALKKQVKLLQKQIDNVGNDLAASMRRIQKRRKNETGAAYKVLADEIKYALIGEKLIEINRTKIQFDDITKAREDVKGLLTTVFTESNSGINKLNLSRGERIAALKGKIEKINPNYWPDRVKQLQAKLDGVETRIGERAAKAGIPDFNARTGVAAFDEQARLAAWDTYNKILSFDHKVGGIDLAVEERGSAIKRSLTIESAKIEDFLENDIEVVLRNYLRQMVPDIELKKKFGDVELKTQRDLLKLELNEVLERGKVNTNAEEGEPAYIPWTENEAAKINLEFETHLNNIMSSVARLRNQWGLPKDPHGFGARAGKFILDWNNLRLMGGVIIASLTDPGRIVTKNGLARTMKTALIPFVSGLKGIKMAREEARILGIGLDPYTHSRAAALSDIMEESYRTSKIERVVHTASAKFGNFAGFNYYTQVMKDWNFITATTRLSDDMQTLFESSDSRAIQKAQEELAYLQIDANMAARIWGQMKESSSVVRGVKLANTESWVDKEAVDVWANAMVQLSRDTIIEPGLELPLFANSSVTNRLFFQFKSFGLASHTKTLAANLQQADVRVLNGLMVSVGLGMVGYYLSAIIAGGESEKRMRAADLNAWIDEGIARAGLLGVFDTGFRVANKLAPLQALNEEYPMLDALTPFAGQPLSRFGSMGLAGELLGPSGDLINRGIGIVQSLPDPNEQTVRNTRMVIPYENTLALRRIFDALEGVGNDIVENSN